MEKKKENVNDFEKPKKLWKRKKTLCFIIASYRTKVIKILWHGNKCRLMEQNKYSYMYNQLIFNKGAEVIQGEGYHFQ